MFDTESKSDDEMIDVKNKTNYNDDDNSNVVNFNENGEEVDEVEETILDDSDNTTLDNNEVYLVVKNSTNVIVELYKFPNLSFFHTKSSRSGFYCWLTNMNITFSKFLFNKQSF